MGTVDTYFEGLAPAERATLAHIRDVAMELAPDAEQGTSYGMAALKYNGKPVIAVIAAKKHLSLFPFSSAVVDASRARLEGYSLSKGTIRFSVDRPIPDEVLREIIGNRLNEINRP